MVFDDPPAPAERDELGLETCEAAARRRICAPGGLATVVAEEREETERAGASESDMGGVVKRR